MKGSGSSICQDISLLLEILHNRLDTAKENDEIIWHQMLLNTYHSKHTIMNSQEKISFLVQNSQDLAMHSA
jgi:hypothetical protein